MGWGGCVSVALLGFDWVVLGWFVEGRAGMKT
jgi:hypothetical protein